MEHASKRGEFWGVGALGLLACTVFLAINLGSCTTTPLPLEHSDGASPLVESRTVGSRPAARTVDHHLWDVRKRLTSSFTVEQLFGDGEITRLLGHFDISVPPGCADRTVHWEITADGERIGQGRLRWLRKYEVPTELPVHGAPATITVTAWWNGGTGTCPSFALGWDDAGLDREADFNFLDPDFYPG
ncbi:hypothetical protein [Streptomyces sp. NPDC050804]|uniref:hypothetical protein n=1 Tax=Streptomyces sp. NPDC050804 TaxID=3154745 RepID=UPI00343CAF12